jgi:hypothetical protein
MKKYIVRLADEERAQLQNILSNGKAAAKKHVIAKVLVLADVSANGPANTDEEIQETVGVSLKTIGIIRKKFVEEGFDAPFTRKPYPPSNDLIFGGEEEAKLTVLCCGEPPTGYARWSLRLLADKVVELKIVEATSHETIRRTLKKTNLSLG